jgi:hypothetical protein
MPGTHTSVEGVRVTKSWAQMLGGDPVPWLLSSVAMLSDIGEVDSRHIIR